MSHEERYTLFGVVGRLEVIIEFTTDSILKEGLIKCHRELCEVIDRPDYITELRARLEELKQSTAED